jgi:hypothetical protein
MSAFNIAVMVLVFFAGVRSTFLLFPVDAMMAVATALAFFAALVGYYEENAA